MPSDRSRPTSLGASRMEAFSDGVFGIAATLLVLEITLHPPGSPTGTAAPRVALVSGLCRQFPHDRSGVARSQRVDRATVGRRFAAVAHQPHPAPRHRVPSVPDTPCVGGLARRRRRAGLHHVVRIDTPDNSPSAAGPGRIRPPCRPLRSSRARRTKTRSNIARCSPSSSPTWPRFLSALLFPEWRPCSISASPCTSSCRSARSGGLCSDDDLESRSNSSGLDSRNENDDANCGRPSRDSHAGTTGDEHSARASVER